MGAKSNRSYKNYIIPIVLTCLFLGVISVFALGYVSENRQQISNTIINDSGMYYNDGNSYRGVSSGTADVVVCRGTNAFDDVYKSVKWASGCDVVCKSDNTNCGLLLNSSILTLSNNGGGFIYISSGIYPTSVYVSPRSNVKILGSGSATVLNISGINEYFRWDGGTLDNFELGNVKFIQGTASLSVGFALERTYGNNIYLHDIDFGNINFLCFRIIGNNDLYKHTNIKIERVICQNSSFTIGSVDGLIIKDSYFSAVSTPNNNVLSDIGFSEAGNSVNNVKVISNTFIDLFSEDCISSSGTNTNMLISNNYFYCNGTSINFQINNLTAIVSADIIGNIFDSNIGFVLGSVFILTSTRNVSSFLNINSNQFIDVGVKYGIVNQIFSNINGNTFKGTGYSAIKPSAESHIIGNTFINCDNNDLNWRWIYFATIGASYSSVVANHFKLNPSGSPVIIQFVNSQNISVMSNTYSGISGTSVYGFNGGNGGIEENSTYMDDRLYSTITTSCLNSNLNPFKEKAIHNLTTSCTCVNGVWKDLTGLNRC